MFSHIYTKTEGRLESSELFNYYSEACAEKNLSVLPRNTFFRILQQLFPTAKLSKIRLLGSRKQAYVGIDYREEETCNNPLKPSDVPTYLMPNSFVMSSTDNIVKIGMLSNIICNGNTIMKNITLNFQLGQWSLKIREKVIALNKLGVSKEFKKTATDLRTILYVSKIINVCIGIDVVHKKLIPANIIAEHVCLASDENSKPVQKMRCRFCSGVTSWMATGNACRYCCSFLNDFKNSDQENLINLDNTDEDDIEKIFHAIFPKAPPQMKTFLKSQHDALQVEDKRSRKWDKSIIKASLSLWSRSPQSYRDLRDSNLFILPSGGLLQRYKNIAPQNAGINPEVFKWMFNTAKKMNIPISRYSGGIIHDEAKIQEDLVINFKGKENKLIGWVDTGEEQQTVRTLMHQDVKQTLASSVLQVSFLGYSGFRFPIAHYPTSGVTASELYCNIWEIISNLQSWNFTTDFILQDGGDQNREFMKIHFKGEKDAKSCKYMSDNLVNPGRRIAHSQDYSHNIKKLRNAILSSGIHKHNTRKLIKADNCIVWDQWVNAAHWDENTNSRKINIKITSSHLHPDSSEKMRNHLAEEMLNSDMLHLMKMYRDSLQNGRVLDAAIEFLEQTSELINIFRNPRPISSIHDGRLKNLSAVLCWFQTWRNEIEALPISSKEKESRLPSRKCLDDIESMICTFTEICTIHISEFPGEGVSPSRYNSDIIENNFCQMRGLHNGNTTNPSYNQYMSTMNSIVLGQSSISRGRKSNVGIPAADPLYLDVTVDKKKAKKAFSDITNTLKKD